MTFKEPKPFINPNNNRKKLLPTVTVQARNLQPFNKSNFSNSNRSPQSPPVSSPTSRYGNHNGSNNLSPVYQNAESDSATLYNNSFNTDENSNLYQQYQYQEQPQQNQLQLEQGGTHSQQEDFQQRDTEQYIEVGNNGDQADEGAGEHAGELSAVQFAFESAEEFEEAINSRLSKIRGLFGRSSKYEADKCNALAKTTSELKERRKRLDQYGREVDAHFKGVLKMGK